MPASPPVWFITGCSSGLGRALAVAALARGDRVVATAREVAALGPLAAEHPEHCRTFALDVTDAQAITAAVAGAMEAFGRIDVLVSNAGCGLVGALEECSEEELARTFEVNFFGALRVIRATLPHFRAQRGGQVVAISAAAAIANYPGFSAYGAAKRALEGALESLAQEGRPFGLKVTLVQPGPFRTDFVGRSLARAATTLPDYEASSGKFGRFLATRAAAAILATVDAERPPLRLVLGPYAQDKAKRTLAAAQRELETWTEAGRATDFQSPCAGP